MKTDEQVDPAALKWSGRLLGHGAALPAWFLAGAVLLMASTIFVDTLIAQGCVEYGSLFGSEDYSDCKPWAVPMVILAAIAGAALALAIAALGAQVFHALRRRRLGRRYAPRHQAAKGWFAQSLLDAAEFEEARQTYEPLVAGSFRGERPRVAGHLARWSGLLYPATMVLFFLGLSIFGSYTAPAAMLVFPAAVAFLVVLVAPAAIGLLVLSVPLTLLGRRLSKKAVSDADELEVRHLTTVRGRSQPGRAAHEPAASIGRPR